MDMQIVAVGAVTPIGLSLAETASSARARIARVQEIAQHDKRFEPFLACTVPSEALPELDAQWTGAGLTAREARMLRLGHAALEQIAQGLAQEVDLGAVPPMPLLLGLPEHHTTLPIDPARFLQRLAAQSGFPFSVGASVAAARGRAAGVMALRRAAAWLESGEHAFVLVGGVDTLVDPYVLATLDKENRIRGETNSDGLTPGEGAVFLLLAGAAEAKRFRLASLARITGAAIGREAGHLYATENYLGDGLAATFTELLESSPPSAPIECVYASFNGERYWAREFGTARIRNTRHFHEEALMEHPAECYGDLGAAVGPALTALAAQALHARRLRAPCLAYASSDRGDRAAVLLEKAS